jgi:creatinine amidohydrolase/Fe(II)-dependent formamide hydrolase-like protein
MRQRTDHGAVGYCELASADKGHKMIAAAAARVVEVVQALLKKPLPK